MTRTERFFSREFPAAIVQALPRFGVLQGVLAFSCAGEKWTVRLGNLDRPVESGFDRRADVKLWFRGDAFERFLDGTLTPGPGLRVQGNLDVLERFGRFLNGGGSPLQVRLSR